MRERGRGFEDTNPSFKMFSLAHFFRNSVPSSGVVDTDYFTTNLCIILR